MTTHTMRSVVRTSRPATRGCCFVSASLFVVCCVLLAVCGPLTSPVDARAVWRGGALCLLACLPSDIVGGRPLPRDRTTAAIQLMHSTDWLPTLVEGVANLSLVDVDGNNNDHHHHHHHHNNNDVQATNARSGYVCMYGNTRDDFNSQHAHAARDVIALFAE